jgi:hypothetical protein
LFEQRLLPVVYNLAPKKMRPRQMYPAYRLLRAIACQRLLLGIEVVNSTHIEMSEAMNQEIEEAIPVSS